VIPATLSTIKIPMSEPVVIQHDLPILEYPFTIHSYQCDSRRRLTIPALFGIFGEAAHFDATRRGWGFESMLRQNRAWVLIRMIVNFNRVPLWSESLILKTWPKSMEGVVAYRDFLLLDAERRVLLSGTTAWSIMDLEKRRPVRMTGEEYNTGRLGWLHAVEEKPEKIAWPDSLTAAATHYARFSHLDMNDHVNNSRYFEWVLNEFPLDVLQSNDISRLHVNFLAEIRPDDAVEVKMPPINGENNVYQGFVTRISDNQPAFAGSFTFKPSN
jgi:acyl-ACP thioesterase